jgi:hypothetical protein
VRPEALHEEGEGLVQLALRFGCDGVEDQRRFPGAGHTGKHRDLLLGNVERDVLEVVLARAANLDELAIRHACLLAERKRPTFAGSLSAKAAALGAVGLAETAAAGPCHHEPRFLCQRVGVARGSLS